MSSIIISNQNITFTHTDLILLTLLIVWEGVWKLIALWKSARNRQLAWFLIMGIVNTAGILEIIYIFFLQKKSQPTANDKSST